MSYWFTGLILLFSSGRCARSGCERMASEELSLIKPDVRIGSQPNKSDVPAESV
jgi:hypothetical protein